MGEELPQLLPQLAIELVVGLALISDDGLTHLALPTCLFRVTVGLQVGTHARQEGATVHEAHSECLGRRGSRLVELSASGVVRHEVESEVVALRSLQLAINTQIELVDVLEGVVLIGNARVTDNVLKELGDELAVVGVGDGSVANLAFDLLLVIGEVLVLVAVASHVELILQLVKGAPDVVLELGWTLIEGAVEQHPHVSRSGAKVATILDQQ